jgi:hypothetical protein
MSDARIAELEMENKRLRKALEPFAAVAWKWKPFHREYEISLDLTAGHLFDAARTAGIKTEG